jgi:hypothetical protein
MPMHDWTCVPADIFHAFHHGWISSICTALNRGILPSHNYAMPEQLAADSELAAGAIPEKITTQTEAEFYRRKKSSVVVRHVSGDQIVAIIEIVSPGNKASKHAVRSFVTKACELLEHHIHLLIVDLFPPGPRDPGGVHGLIWGEVTDEEYRLPADKPPPRR